MLLMESLFVFSFTEDVLNQNQTTLKCQSNIGYLVISIKFIKLILQIEEAISSHLTNLTFLIIWFLLCRELENSEF